ncbi:hypothetical protein [Bacillus thuringiensis]|uniref:hypothetical protein n=1 Tax=Bacillus thuringiensis TaxID=1428 RepID=UPI000A3B0633|nr:hypothetical protein [Bacillus thuringiensis]OUA88939.1 hypothetical protein BK706_16985 [Bacillus thuringiensis serovar leesis]OUA94602.1 hypothetical protein BK706_07660 [Bacillus thuringiensis serovar leesis]OUA94630.1 hypothetical protein BK706_07615 [Bacillus thuringiensis serovar leesis]OUA94827.1 hypothetical protein BK706_07555 [Bacillus thuringiensis serovar leesis]
MIKKIVGLIFVIGLLGGCTFSQEDGKSDLNADKPKQIESPNRKPGDSSSIRMNEEGSISNDENGKSLDPKIEK